jgi:hypothetical protein
MAIQDDIIAMLSQVSDAGDRATDRGRRGRELYGQIADRLSGDNRSKAMREIAMLSGNPEMSIEEQMRNDSIIGSRVADIIEKYMDDAGDGVPAAVPNDMIVDDTRAAEQMMEVMPSPDASPRTSVSAEEPPRPDFDEAALESMEREIRQPDEGLAGLLAGQEAPEAGLLVGTPPTPVQTGGYRGEFAGTPGTSVGMNPVSDGRIPLKERLFAGQEAAGGPMSGSEQLMYSSVLIPAALLPQAAVRVGMGAAQIARFLRGGKKGEDALRQVIRQRTQAQMMRDPSTGRMISSKDVGPFQTRNPLQEKLYQQMQNPGGPTGGLARGGSIRDKILRNYAMMADGGSVDDEETKRIENMNRRMDEATSDYLKGFPQGFVRDVLGLIDSDERLLNKAAKENIRMQGRRNFKRVYGD